MALSLRVGIVLCSLIFGVIAGSYSYFAGVEDKEMHRINQEAIINEIHQIKKQLETFTHNNKTISSLIH